MEDNKQLLASAVLAKTGLQMKREMNVKLSTLVGVLILGIAMPGFAEGETAPQHSGASAQAARPEAEQGQLPQLYKDVLGDLKSAVEAKEIKTQATLLSGEVKEITLNEEQITKVTDWVTQYGALRVKLEACDAKDKSSKALAILMDEYTKALRWSLWDKKDTSTTPAKVEIAKNADEKKLIALTSQIHKLLLARGKKSASEANKPYSSEIEKKVAGMLDNQLKMFFTDNNKEKFGDDKQLADASHKARVEDVNKAISELDASDSVDFCSLEEKPATNTTPNGSRPNTNTSTPDASQVSSTVTPPVGGNPDEQPELETDAPPGEEGNQFVENGGAPPVGGVGLDPSGLLARLDQLERDRQNEALAAQDLIRQAVDAQSRLAADLARQQAEALALQNLNNDDALAAALKALGQNNNDQPIVTPPAPPAPPAPVIPPQPLSEQQPFFPPQDFGGEGLGQQQPFMMPQFPQPNASQPQIYVAEPSRFAEDDEFYRRSSQAAALQATPINPALAGLQAQQQLLMALRGGVPGMAPGGMPGMPGFNPYGQVGANVNTSMASRIGQVQAPRTNVQTSTSAGAMRTGNGLNQLAATPGARSNATPSFVRGRLGR